MKTFLTAIGLSLCALIAICAMVFLFTGPWPESAFQLAPESRLPRWFTPQSVKPPRATAVTVQMTYYSGFFSRRATFTLRDSRGAKLAEVEGQMRWSEPYTKGNSRYPKYEAITAAGITEVIEHRAMEPVFYITDDSGVKEWLGVK